MLLISCDTYEYRIPNQGIIYPAEVHVYIDCSFSMKGFFAFENSEAIRLIGNINTEFKKKGIPVIYHRFSETVDTQDREGLSWYLIDEDFYSCQQNLFSNPIDQIINEEVAFGKSVYIILTDAVTSTANTNIEAEQESAMLQNVLAGYARDHQSNISLYQFSFGFRGFYYPQPRGRVWVGDGVKRNFYAISFGHLKHTKFLDQLFTEVNEAETYEHFNAPLNSRVSVPSICNYQYITNKKLIIDLNLRFEDSLIHPYITNGEYREELNFIEHNGVRNRYEVYLPGITADTSFIQVPRQSKLSPWNELNYDVEEEPISAYEIDHSKTFRLNLLTKAFAQV